MRGLRHSIWRPFRALRRGGTAPRVETGLKPDDGGRVARSIRRPVVDYRLDIAFAEGAVKLPNQINILLLLHGEVLSWNELEILGKKTHAGKANCKLHAD
jgi:hypothetical protein